MTFQCRNVGSRRDFLRATGLFAAGACLPGLTLADAVTDARFVLVMLRGALDGLAAVPAYGDGNFARSRGQLAITSPQLRLDGLFGLHPALQQLHQRYLAKELLVVHAVASPYRERSHFDGQDLLEAGLSGRAGIRDGWLNRALASLPMTRERSSNQLAVALAQTVPLVLRGPTSVNSWAPSRLPQADADTLERLADLYANEPVLAGRLQTALASNEAAAGDALAGRDPLGAFKSLSEAAGKLMATGDGARIAVIDASGWDTHANQGAENGQLANRLRTLDQGLDALRSALGSAWAHTAVMVVTEFGRTVATNGTRGTDHGTASCAFLLGGAVAGGRVIADWPGLSTAALHQGRDLRATTDLRAVFKGVLVEHLRAPQSALEQSVFPDSKRAKALEGLIRNA
jgi:uncharacterized protein (DUF1501 family)